MSAESGLAPRSESEAAFDAFDESLHHVVEGVETRIF
jgi:hypothetical protein